MNAAVQASDADANYALGRHLKAAEDFEGAESAYRAALQLRPEFTDAWVSLGILMRRQGRIEEAEVCQREVLRFDPGNHLAHLNLANLLVVAARNEEAEAEFRAALAANPLCAEAHNNLGHLCARLARAEEAIRHFAEALQLVPDYFAAASGLGEALFGLDRFEAAIEALQKANRLRPEDLNVRTLLGRSYGDVGDHARAAAELESVLALDPGRLGAIRGLTKAQVYLGQYTKPRAALAAAVRRPDCDDFTRFAFATLLLRAGEFREAWAYYDARRDFQHYGNRRFGVPRWRGENLADKTLLISREQGLGDEIMFASVFGDIGRVTGHCILECNQRLEALFRRSFPGFTFYGVPTTDDSWGTVLESSLQAVPHFDYWAASGDLPEFFRNEESDFAERTPYLVANPERVAYWREHLARHFGPGPKVGIGWRGGLPRTRTRERSIGLENLKPVLTTPGVHFISVQYGQCTQELAEFRASSSIVIEHWPEVIDDLDDYAALICALDVVISVCSTVVHLGGALARPVWVMAPRVPEWRYGHAGESMTWYPSVRMFRQAKSQDWRPVIAEVARALRKLKS